MVCAGMRIVCARGSLVTRGDDAMKEGKEGRGGARGGVGHEGEFNVGDAMSNDKQAMTNSKWREERTTQMKNAKCEMGRRMTKRGGDGG